jgi:hypothetical protein
VVISRKQEIDLPTEVAVSYMDPALDYQTGTQRSKKTTGKSTTINSVSLDFPITMTANEAVQTADILLHQDWVSRTAFSIQTTRKHLAIDPADIVTFTADTETHTALVTSVSIDPDGTVKVDAVRDLAGAYTSTKTSDSGVFVIPGVDTSAPTIMQVLDLPRWFPSKDTADPFGPQFVCCPATGGAYKGAAIWHAADNIDFSVATDATSASVLGVTTTTLATVTDWTVLDETNTVTVALFNGANNEMDSMSGSQLVDGENLCRIGSEIVQFETATEDSYGNWVLSDLWRGRCGTEWAVGTHTSAEAFALLDETKVISAYLAPDSNYTMDAYYKGVTRGRTETETLSQAISFEWNYLKPYAPINLAGTENSATNDWTLTWERRDRKDHTQDSNTAMSEETEAYEVDIIDTSDSNMPVVRTLSGSTLDDSTAVYTSAMITADSITTFQFVVYQISATVGRGFGANSDEYTASV